MGSRHPEPDAKRGPEEKGGAKRLRNLKGAGARVVVDALVDEGAARRVQAQGVALDTALKQTDNLPEGKQQQGHTDTSEIETPRVGKAILPVMSLGMGSKCGTAGMRWNGGGLVLRLKFLT
jgi:hypothetical protein